MPKAYWISAYRAIHDPEALAAYAKLAGPALQGAGGPVGLKIEIARRLEHRLTDIAVDARAAVHHP